MGTSGKNARLPLAITLLLCAIACGGADRASDVLVVSGDNLDSTNGISLNGISEEETPRPIGCSRPGVLFSNQSNKIRRR